MHAFLRNLVVQILTFEAQLVLKRYQPKIVAVTGSAGKTTTKDAIYAVLSADRLTRKSTKSYNSELGVPLTILGLETGWDSPWRWLLNILKGAWVVIQPRKEEGETASLPTFITQFSEKYPHWLVLEVGADRPGDIRRTARWLRPDFSVITSIPDVPVHVEFFESPAKVAHEKKQLAKYLKHDGLLIINGDDIHTKHILEEFKTQAVSFGFEGHNAFIATESGILYEEIASITGKSTRRVPVGMHFYSNHSNTPIEVSLYGALGKPRIYAALAALAVAEAAGISQEEAAASLQTWEPPPGRMHIIHGLKGSIIIDDTYNSSPSAAHSALETLKEIKGFKRRIAVMGDMMELGRFSKDAHIEVGTKAAKCATMLVTVGLRSRATAEAALSQGMPDSNIRQYELGESSKAGKELEMELDKNTVVLIKGSQSMRMEKAVEELMAEPLRAPELLVRQDPDWKAR